MTKNLEELLQSCTVKIIIPDAGWGTGFFVAPGKILTCAHIISRLRDQPIHLQWEKQDFRAQASVITLLPDPYDLALLRCKLPTETGLECVYLDEEVRSRDPLYLFGYPDQGDTHGEPRTVNCDGITGSKTASILFNQGQIRPGMSGSPLLNQRTGKVCGIVKFTRDRTTDLGGGAIPTSTIFEQIPKLRELQHKYHKKNPQWKNILYNHPLPSRDDIRKKLTQYLKSGADNLNIFDNPRPSNLLRAEYSVVPFTGREDLLEHMLEWCKSSSSFSIQVLHGQAGMGKTRLMREVCLRLEVDGWITGFLHHRGDLRHSYHDAFQQMTDSPFPFLLIIDYTETQYHNVEILLELLRERDNKIPFRLVLVARQLGEWFEWIRINYIDRDVFEEEVFFETKLVDIASDYMRRELFWAARRKFNSLIYPDLNHQEVTNSVYEYRDFSKNMLGRPLIIQLTALVEVLGYKETKLDKLFKHLFNHEERYWLNLIRKRYFHPSPALTRACKLLVAINTLLAGQSCRGLRDIAEKIPSVFDLESPELRDVLAILSECYEIEPNLLEPLQPDLIGELLISEVLSAEPNLFKSLLSCISHDQVKVVFEVLNRAAEHFDAADKWLDEGLACNFSQFSPIMLTVASETGGKAARSLTKFIKKGLLDRATTQKLEKNLPNYTVDLREARVLIVENCLSYLTEKNSISERARLLAKLSAYLLGLARLADAQEKAREAADYYRRIAKNNPIHLENLAFSLTIYAEALVGETKIKEAEKPAREAFEIYKVLDRKGVDKARLRLANSQNTLATIIGEARDFSVALQLIDSSIQIYQEHKGKSGYAYSVELASCLANKSLLLGALGRQEEALWAALNATRLFRKFIENRRGQCHFELAIGLLGLASRYYELGSLEQAFTFSKESEKVLRNLSKCQPNAFKRYLARVLLNQAMILRVINNRISDQPAREAVKIYQEIFDSSLADTSNELSIALSNLGDILREQGKNSDAIDLFYKAISLELEAQIISNKNASLPWISASIVVRHNLSLALKNLGKYDDALERSIEALHRLIPLFEEHQELYFGWMKKLIANYQAICVESDKPVLEEFRKYFDL